ncbi:MAG: class I SAM-dependent methyltransferase [Methanobacteriota archaeon]
MDGAMTADSWERMADWYDERQGDTGDFWHRNLIDPTFVRTVGDVRGLRVLDLGCGNGHLSRRFAREGAKVVEVDASAPIVERARARESQEPLGVEYHAANAARLDFLLAASFDVVASNMALMDIDDADGAIREAARVLRASGRFVASLSHPCFDQGPTSTWLLERFFRNSKAWRKIERYREPFADEIPWEVAPGKIVTTTGYHRPLSWYARAFREAGFLIRSLEEPAPTEEFVKTSPQGLYIAEIPLHLIIEGVRVRSPVP